jgi:hypothetical protein
MNFAPAGGAARDLFQREFRDKTGEINETPVALRYGIA